MALMHKAINAEKEQYRLNLEAIFRSVKDAIITVDRHLRVVELNSAAATVCGLTRSDIGRDFSSLAVPCVEDCLSALSETIQKKHSVELLRLECRQEGKSGKVISLATASLLDDQGEFSGAVIIIKDETRLAGLERDLQGGSSSTIL
jgi:PAS domain S-box-containing protein